MLTRRLLGGVLVVLLVSGVAGAQTPPDVNCTSAQTRVARVVCASPELLNLGQIIADSYLASLPLSDSPALEVQQRSQWLQRLNRCDRERGESLTMCVGAAYQDRYTEVTQRLSALKAVVAERIEAAASLKQAAEDTALALERARADAEAQQEAAQAQERARAEREAAQAQERARAEYEGRSATETRQSMRDLFEGRSAAETRQYQRDLPQDSAQSTPTVVSKTAMDTTLMALSILTLAAAVIALCLLPYLIARHRGHAYRNIILVLCIFGILGVTWVIALIWAIYPSEKSLLDPALGNPTGVGSRNVGDTLGAVAYGRERGYAMESPAAPASAVEKPQPVVETHARFCRACGTSRTDGAVFCWKCGERM